ncbi:hypothetical protein [Nocardia sp. NPDC051750]|uniref:hypothetical protein n=1 Tax=Nocardia sp. NPDC051750 TaxID=3364325 RepID=UPI0037B8DCC7
MVVSNNAARRTPPYRYAVLAAAGVAAAVSLLPAPAADAAGPAGTPAAVAVHALTSPAPASALRIPDDFGDIAGYRPALAEGMLIAPHGSCSSPVPLPAEFETACKAHDLGYDLLRYAQHSGHPLGSWARRDLDRTLAGRMRATCTHRTDPLARARCSAMAEVAAVAVDLNSRRQDYGVPVVEHFSPAETAATWLPRVSALVLAAFAALLVWRAVAGGRIPRREVPGRREWLRNRVDAGHRALARPGYPLSSPRRRFA